jgi:hypothetical protein
MDSQQQLHQASANGIVGTQDGVDAADCDRPYCFGRRPRASAPFPFTTREYARLLVLRGRVQDGLFGSSDVAP